MGMQIDVGAILLAASAAYIRDVSSRMHCDDAMGTLSTGLTALHPLPHACGKCNYSQTAHCSIISLTYVQRQNPKYESGDKGGGYE